MRNTKRRKQKERSRIALTPWTLWTFWTYLCAISAGERPLNKELWRWVGPEVPEGPRKSRSIEKKLGFSNFNFAFQKGLRRFRRECAAGPPREDPGTGRPRRFPSWSEPLAMASRFPREPCRSAGVDAADTRAELAAECRT